MTETEWLACKDPSLMLARCQQTWQCARNRRLFAVACCRRIVGLMTDAGARAVNAAEAFADGALGEALLHDFCRLVGFPKKGPRQYANAAARAVSSLHSYADETVGAAAFAANTFAKTPGTPDAAQSRERAVQSALLRDIFGNPFRPVAFSPEWRTDTAVALARTMYESREFSAMPILADALQDAGCDSDDVLNHCREPGTHVRGCWVVDLVLGKS